jgi:hypothetical protein
VNDKSVITVDDARAKARLILRGKLLDSEIIITDSGDWAQPVPEEVERIVTVVSDWLWGSDPHSHS